MPGGGLQPSQPPGRRLRFGVVCGPTGMRAAGALYPAVLQHRPRAGLLGGTAAAVLLKTLLLLVVFAFNLINFTLRSSLGHSPTDIHY